MGLIRQIKAAISQNEIAASFFETRAAWISAAVLLVLALGALFAPFIASVNPFDLESLDVMDAHLPPSWAEGGDSRFILGTDDQGRDLFSAILYGLRLSFAISLTSVVLSIVIGVAIGVFSGFIGGWVDVALMRLCDVMLSFPAILVALLTDGILRSIFPGTAHESLSYVVLIFALTLSGWVPYARTVRGLTLVEKGKEYVTAAEVIGEKYSLIMKRHIFPNVLGPVFVLAAVNVATAVMTEATLSFLGVGVPPTTPSLGTLIRIGNDYLFSGEWWISIFPGVVLIAAVLAVNLLGDWLRDATNPSLQ